MTSMNDANAKPIALYVDADACPVKQEVYRVAERFARKGTALKVVVVSNSPIAVPRDLLVERTFSPVRSRESRNPDLPSDQSEELGPRLRGDGRSVGPEPRDTALVEPVVVGAGMDAADDYIAGLPGAATS